MSSVQVAENGMSPAGTMQCKTGTMSCLQTKSRLVGRLFLTMYKGDDELCASTMHKGDDELFAAASRDAGARL